MRNGRDRRSGKPAMCHASKERELMFGTRSADYIRASGHNGCINRPNTWLHPNASLKCPIFSLAPRAPSIHGTNRTSLAAGCPVSGGLNRSTQHFILNGKDGVCGDQSKLSSRFQCGRENGVMGSLATGRVAESDWASIW